ncbi:MAG: glycosyltransferase family 39 protein [Nitrospirales bacterium]|nr:glycosyltransferase family 39 protein [Nitrospirales bacterium]
MVHGFGWSEAAIRLPSALASLGTMITSYFLGRFLFSSFAGFWAALVVGTCYAGLWFGPLGIIDPVLTLYDGRDVCPGQAYFEASAEWYVVAFVAFSCGTMVKSFHGLALPLVIFGLFLIMQRETRPLRSRWFWCGVITCGLLLTGYFFLMSQEFRDHFIYKENLWRLVAQVGDEKHSALEAYWGKRPIHWYGYTIWFDLFPWSVLLPVGLFLLWKQGPWPQVPKECWVWVWAVGYFLALSLVPEKHERYLLPLVPAMGLVVGFLFHRLGVEPPLGDIPISLQFSSVSRESLCGCGLPRPGVVAQKVACLNGYHSLPMQICLGILGILVIGLAFRARLNEAVLGVGVLGLALMVTVTECAIPGILEKGSPRQVVQDIRQGSSWPTEPILGFAAWDWRGDEDVFYMDSFHGHSRLVAENQPREVATQQLIQEISLGRRVKILMTEEQLQHLGSDAPELDAEILMEFYRSKKRIVWVSLKEKNGRG